MSLLPASPALTARQRQCLGAVVWGASAKEIARTLGLSPETVREHLEEAYRRLGAHGRSQAVTRARELGILPEVNPPSWGEEPAAVLRHSNPTPQSGRRPEENRNASA